MKYQMIRTVINRINYYNMFCEMFCEKFSLESGLDEVSNDTNGN